MTEASFHRLIIRFTNGETVKFIVREPVDTSRIAVSSQFVLVRSHEEEASGDPAQVFLASLKDISYLKVERVSAKDLRSRVTGMAGVLEEASGPEMVSTVEFI